jgi:hypothetical protein
MTRVRKLAAVLAGGAILAGCATHAAPPLSAKQLAYARSFHLYTVYWAGKRMDGVPLTAADGAGDYDSNIGISMYYGNCEPGGGLLAPGCKLPLKITTVRYVPHSNRSLGKRHNLHLRGVPAVIFDGGLKIELYTDEMSVDIVADTPHRALEAVAHLTTLNRTPTSSWPAFPPPQFQPGVSGKELTLRREATGDTGTVSPPGSLEPSLPASK